MDHLTTSRFARQALLVAVVSMLSCDATFLGDLANKPISATFREQGAACEMNIRFFNLARQGSPWMASSYQAPNGDSALATESREDPHTVVVTFADPIAPGDVITYVGDTGEITTITAERNDQDTIAPELLSAGFMADAPEPTVLLTFDDAIDAAAASNVANYSLQGTTDHPATAVAEDCGLRLRLTFDALPTDTVIDIEDLVDVSGTPVEPRLAVRIEKDREETKPTVASVVLVGDSLDAAIRVTFTEAVDRTSAEQVTHYAMGEGRLAPTGAMVEPGGYAVRLTFEQLDPPITLDATGILDLNGNTMVAIERVDVISDADITPPRLESATVVGRDEGLTISVVFSETVAASSAILVANYALRSGDGLQNVPPTSASIAPGGRSVLLGFTYMPPNAGLEVSGVIDLAGNPITRATIRVDAASAGVKPTVTAITFVSDAVVPMIDVTFDKALDSTFAEDVSHYELSTGARPTKAELLPDGRTVRLTTPALAREDTLTITAVADLDGIVMDSATVAPTASGDDAQSPTVTSTAFGADATSPIIEIVFSEVVDKTAAETASNYTTTDPVQSATLAQLDPDGRTVRATFHRLARTTQLTIKTVTDMAQRAIVTTTTSIDPGDDSTSPAIASATFAPNASAPTMDVVFTEAVDMNQAQTLGLYLTGSDSVPPTSATLQDDGKTVRLVFPPMQRTDVLQVRSIFDLSGNEIASGVRVDAIRASDDQPPFVTSVTFAADTVVPTVVIQFSEAIDENTAETLANISIPEKGLIATTAVLQNDSRTLNVTFSRLARGDALLVDRLWDFGDNRIQQDGAVPISRNLELSAPNVVSTTIATSTTITVVFSEAVDETSAEKVAHYVVDGGGSQTALAVLQDDGRTVIVSVVGGPITAGHTIRISGIEDLSGNVIPQTDNLTLN